MVVTPEMANRPVGMVSEKSTLIPALLSAPSEWKVPPYPILYGRAGHGVPDGGGGAQLADERLILSPGVMAAVFRPASAT